jgi:hypothetical protein
MKNIYTPISKFGMRRALFKALRDLYVGATSPERDAYNDEINDRAVLGADLLLRGISSVSIGEPKRYRDAHSFLQGVSFVFRSEEITLVFKSPTRTISINIDERNKMDSINYDLNDSSGGIHLMHEERGELLSLVMQLMEGKHPLKKIHW